jgi:hypothetical protein
MEINYFKLLVGLGAFVASMFFVCTLASRAFRLYVLKLLKRDTPDKIPRSNQLEDWEKSVMMQAAFGLIASIGIFITNVIR